MVTNTPDGAMRTSRSTILRTDVFATRESWQTYAVNALHTVERLAAELGLADRLHLWPDKSLGNVNVVNRMSSPSPRRGLEERGKRRKEFAPGKGPQRAARSGASESLGPR